MFDKLYEYSLTLGGKLPPPGFQNRRVTKNIFITSSGQLLNIVPVTTEILKTVSKKDKKTGIVTEETKTIIKDFKTYLLPVERPRRSTNITPRLIADNSEYVFGLGNPSKDRHLAYCELLDICHKETKNEVVGYILDWIQSCNTIALTEQYEIKPEDNFNIFVDNKSPFEDKILVKWWDNYSRPATFIGYCSVTGKQGNIAQRSPGNVTGLAGSAATGAYPTSIEFESGFSYGMVNAQNTPIDMDVAETILNTLSYLANSNANSHKIYSSGLTYLFWEKVPVGFNPFGALNDPNPDQISNLFKFVHSGEQGAVDTNKFYMICVSTNEGRMAVRSYHEMTLPQVVTNIQNWFDKLSISSCGNYKPNYAMWSLIKSIFPDHEKNYPKHLVSAMFEAAILGRPIPIECLFKALERLRVSKSDRPVVLLKAVLQELGDTNLEGLVVDHSSPAYHCGRLLAIINYAQFKAVGETGADIRTKYYSAAASTPAATFGHLFTGMNTYLSSLSREHKSKYVEEELAQILSMIGDDFPQRLGYRDQALFALGFYHQRAKHFAKGIEAQNSTIEVQEEEEEDAN